MGTTTAMDRLSGIARREGIEGRQMVKIVIEHERLGHGAD
jgi:hypothetical protein